MKQRVIRATGSASVRAVNLASSRCHCIRTRYGTRNWLIQSRPFHILVASMVTSTLLGCERSETTSPMEIPATSDSVPELQAELRHPVPNFDHRFQLEYQAQPCDDYAFCAAYIVRLTKMGVATRIVTKDEKPGKELPAFMLESHQMDRIARIVEQLHALGGGLSTISDEARASRLIYRHSGQVWSIELSAEPQPSDDESHQLMAELSSLLDAATTTQASEP